MLFFSERARKVAVMLCVVALLGVSSSGLAAPGSLETARLEAVSLIDAGHLEEGLSALERSLVRARREDVPYEIYGHLALMIHYSQRAGAGARSVNYMEQMIEWMEAQDRNGFMVLGAPNEITVQYARLLNQSANHYLMNGSAARALEAAEKSFEATREIMVIEEGGRKVFVKGREAVHSLVLMGGSLHQLGLHADALDHVLEARNRLGQQEWMPAEVAGAFLPEGQRHALYMVNNTALMGVYSALGMFRESIETIDSTISFVAKSDHFRGMNVDHLYLSKAQSYVLMGRIDEAEVLLSSLPDSARTDWLHTHVLGEISFIRGDLVQAEALFRQADCGPHLAALALLGGQPEAALRLLEPMISERKPLHMGRAEPDVRYRYHALRGDIMGQLGDLSAAEQEYRQAIQWIEEDRWLLRQKFSTSLWEELSEADHTGQHTPWFFQGGTVLQRFSPYISLIDVLLEQNRSEEAWDVLMRTRARTIQETLPEVASTLTGTLNEKRASVYRDFLKAQRVALTEDERAWESHLTVARDGLDGIGLWLSGQRTYAPAVALTQPESTILPEDVPLAEGEVLLVFSQGKSQLSVFVLSEDGLGVHRVPLAEISEAVSRYLQLISTPPSRQSANDFADFDGLFEALFGEHGDRIRAADQLTAVPAGVVEQLPLGALVLTGAGEAGERPRFLGESVPVQYALSVPVLIRQRLLSTPSRPTNALVVADPDFSSPADRNGQLGPAQIRSTRPLSALPDVRETRALADAACALTDGNCHKLLGADAHEARLHELDLTPYSLLVFATHGIASPQPALVLSQTQPHELSAWSQEQACRRSVELVQEMMKQSMTRSSEEEAAPVPLSLWSDYCTNYSRYDGLLSAEDVSAWSTQADLVMLIACDSGTGDSSPGEGTMGLSRAFRLSGSQSVIASHWSVAKQESVQLAEEVLARLKQGTPSMLALFEARNALIDAGRWHPFYWSAFTMTGSDAPHTPTAASSDQP